jgi:integrase
VLLTSVRLEEAISLKWSNVDFERGIMTLVQKGERHREIPMTEEIRSLLRSLHGRHPEAVFTFVARKTRRDPHTGEMLIAGNVYPWSYWGVKSAERRDWAKAGLKVKGSRSYASLASMICGAPRRATSTMLQASTRRAICSDMPTSRPRRPISE